MKTLRFRTYMDNFSSKSNRNFCDDIFDENSELESDFPDWTGRSEWDLSSVELPGASGIDFSTLRDGPGAVKSKQPDMRADSGCVSKKETELIAPSDRCAGFDYTSSSGTNVTVFDELSEIVSNTPKVTSRNDDGGIIHSSGSDLSTASGKVVTGTVAEVAHSILPSRPSTLLYGFKSNQSGVKAQQSAANRTRKSTAYTHRQAFITSNRNNKIKRLGQQYPAITSGDTETKSCRFQRESFTDNRSGNFSQSRPSYSQNKNYLYSSKEQVKIHHNALRQEGGFPNKERSLSRTQSTDFTSLRGLDNRRISDNTDVRKQRQQFRRYSLTESSDTNSGMGVYNSYTEANKTYSDNNKPRMMVQNEMKTYALLGDEQMSEAGTQHQAIAHHYQQSNRPSHSIINYVGSPGQHGHSPEVVPVTLSPSPPVHDGRLVGMETSPVMSRSNKIFVSNVSQRQMIPATMHDAYPFRRMYEQPGLFDTRDTPSRDMQMHQAQASVFAPQAHSQQMYPLFVKTDPDSYGGAHQGIMGDHSLSHAHFSGYQPHAHKNPSITSTYLKPPPVDLDDLSEEERERMKIKRERNRVAAAKCRNRRRELLERLEKEAEQLERERELLRDNIRRLQSQKTELGTLLNSHEETCEMPIDKQTQENREKKTNSQ